MDVRLTSMLWFAENESHNILFGKSAKPPLNARHAQNLCSTRVVGTPHSNTKTYNNILLDNP